MTVAKAAQLNDVLGVAKAVTLSDSLTVAKAAALNDVLTVAKAATLNDSLTVALGAQLNSTLDVVAAARMRAGLQVDAAAVLGDALTVAKAAQLNDTLAVAKAATLSDALTVAKAATLNDTLTVALGAQLNSTLDVVAAARMRAGLQVDAAAVLGSTLEVNAAATLKDALTVTGASNFNNAVTVTGAAALNSTLNVQGNATFQNNMTINGNLTVLGGQTSISTTVIEVKDNAILLANNNTADVLESGIEIQYKPAGAAAPVYAGVKRLPGTGKFVFFKEAVDKISESSPSTTTDIYTGVIADSFSCASDRNLKKNIVPLDGALENVEKMRGVYHDWIDEKQSADRQIGVIAQEVQAVYPELVQLGDNGYLSVNYPKLTAVLLQALKELNGTVNELKAVVYGNKRPSMHNTLKNVSPSNASASRASNTSPSSTLKKKKSIVNE